MPLTEAQITALADAVKAVLGVEEDDAVGKRAQAQVQVMCGMVESYTRGRGFTDGVPNAALQGVIVAATARWATNPAMSTSESSTAPLVRAYAAAMVPGESPALGSDALMGSESFSFSGFQGFTELELKILHAYRIRNG